MAHYVLSEDEVYPVHNLEPLPAGELADDYCEVRDLPTALVEALDAARSAESAALTAIRAHLRATGQRDL